jgi:signal transduction histidine kinase
MGSSLFALGLGIRAALIGGLVFGVVELIETGRYYATSLILAAVVLLMAADLIRHIAELDRVLARFVDGLETEAFELPAVHGRGFTGFQRLIAAIEHRGGGALAVRAARERRADHLQALMDNAPVALLTIDPDGTVALANRAASQFAGRAVGALNEIAGLGAAGADALLALQAGRRIVLPLSNGRRVLASAALFSANGTACRLISLQNIESALDAAEVRAWQDLARVLSHEMMNSLTPISSLAHSIGPLVRDLAIGRSGQEAAAAQDVAIAVETIARRSASLTGFVERYRKMAALPRPVKRPVALAELVARLRILAGPVFLEKGQTFDGRVAPENLSVTADSDLLEQALINLLQNASDAVTGRDSPRIALHCAPRDPDLVEITVADNGPGIDPESRDRIFLPFFSTKQGGSGIGLSLARQIALAHDGWIEVSSNESLGASFTLVLPASP